jgi:hypothetical protein
MNYVNFALERIFRAQRSRQKESPILEIEILIAESLIKACLQVLQ